MTKTKSSKLRENNITRIPGANGIAYKVLVRKKGFATVSKTFPTLEEARDFRNMVKGSKDLLNRLAGTNSRKTLGDVIDAYGKAYKGKDKSVPSKLIYWKERLGDWKLVDITRHVVAEELDRLLNEPAKQPMRGKEAGDTERLRSPATVNRYHATLSCVFKLAIKKGFLDDNPTRGIERGGETSRFGRCLSDDERKALMTACKQSEYDRLYLLASMALSTGARLGELMSLTWADLDLGKAVARVSETKNGSPRHLPIIPAALEQIKALPRPIDATECLFPSESDKHKSYVSGFRRHWDKALVDAGIANFRFHDLRHSAASYLTEAGIPLVTVADILGHKTMSMVQRYSHVASKHKAEVVTEAFKDLLN